MDLLTGASVNDLNVLKINSNNRGSYDYFKQGTRVTLNDADRKIFRENSS